MRVWVRSEYVDELAVVFAWLTPLIPWNVTFSDLGAAGSLLYVRFPLFQVLYAYGVPLAEAVSVDSVVGAYHRQATTTLGTAYVAWGVGAAVVAVAVLFAVAMYLELDALERLPVASATAVGALLVLAGVGHAAATVLLVTRGLPGVPVPLGVLFQLVFGGVLLGAARE